MKKVFTTVGATWFLLAGITASTEVAYAGDDCPAGFNTCIDVDDVGDVNESITETCTYDSGALFNPASPCTFRRAWIEAGGRPKSDRPILIRFNLPAGQENSSPSGTWTIDIDGRMEPLETISLVTQPDTLVTIDGATQPGGRPASEGPSVFINNNDWPLEVLGSGNTFQNLGFYGGGSLSLRNPSNSAPGNHAVDNVWYGLDESGTEIVPVDPIPLGGPAGNAVEINGCNTSVTNSVFAGVDIGVHVVPDNECEDVTIEGNYFGTRADGTVPNVNPFIKCRAALNFDFGDWYGGTKAIRITRGENFVIRNNTFVGLQNLRSPNDTPPSAIEFGNVVNLEISNNLFGVDSAGTEHGLCGGAINGFASTSAPSGRPTLIQDNVIYGARKQFEEDTSDSVVYVSGNTAIGWLNNLVEDSTYSVADFAPGTAAEWRNFEPPTVISRNGLEAEGVAAPGSVCIGCDIEIFIDDLDCDQEAFELVGETVADNDGNFNAVLERAPERTETLRVIATTAFTGVIGTFGSGTSTRMSGIYSEDLIFRDRLGDRCNI